MPSGVCSTIWEKPPHTRAKHRLLEKYLNAWFPILNRYNKKIVYFDGFAGPGIYTDGSPGSPIIALNVVNNHIIDLTGEIHFYFIECEKRRCEKLSEEINKIDLKDNIHFNIINDTFEDYMESVLKTLEDQERQLAPSFIFADPFGYSQIPFDIMKGLMSYTKCELLITFMFDYINRNLGKEDQGCHFNGLFGTTEWSKALSIQNPEKKKEYILNLYVSQLKREAEIKYIRSFEMINDKNHTEYFLIFGTNHLRGLSAMKDAMWDVDETGGYRFSDNTDPYQTVLFETEPDFAKLKRMILNRYKGKTISGKELENFVIEQTPFKRTHYKRQILNSMENCSPPEINVENRRRKGSYPDYCNITFL